MTKYKLNYVIICLCVFLFSMLYQSRLSSILFIATILIGPLSFVIGLINSFFVKVNIESNQIQVEKNQNIALKLHITNFFLIPLAPVVIVGEFPSFENHAVREQHILLNIMPLSSEDVVFQGAMKYRGLYKVKVKHIELYDPLKLFRFKRRKNRDVEITVVPRVLAIKDISGQSEAQIENENTTKTFTNKTELASIREYRVGDLLQSVHWKLSAKQDDLVVKEYESNLLCNSMIIFDYSYDGAFGERSFAATDTVIECALAIAYQNIHAFNTTQVIYEDDEGLGKLNNLKLRNQEEFKRFFIMVAKLPFRKQTYSIPEMIDMEKIIENDANNIYVISPWYDRNIVKKLMSISIERDKRIFYLYVYATSDQERHINSLAASSNITVVKLNAENLADSINMFL